MSNKEKWFNRCYKCGKPGHFIKDCPKNTDNKYVIEARIDNLNNQERSDLRHEIIKAKEKIAPNARGTILSGKASEIRNRIKELGRKLIGKNRNYD
jgi:hypothetical protein